MGFLRDFIRQQAAAAEQETPPVDVGEPIDPSRLTDADIEELVDCLLDDDLAYEAGQLLLACAPRARRPLEAALQSGRLFTETAISLREGGSSLDQALRCLSVSHNPLVIDVMRPHLDSTDKDVRELAVEALARHGLEPDLPQMLELLSAPTAWNDRTLRDFLRGLSQRLKLDVPRSSWMDALIAPLWTLMDQPYWAWESAGVLLEIDEVGTLARIRSEVFADPSTTKDGLRRLTQWLSRLSRRDYGVRVDEVDNLWHFVTRENLELEDHERVRMQGHLMDIGARVRSPLIRRQIDQLLVEPFTNASYSAVSAHALWHGIELDSLMSTDPRTADEPISTCLLVMYFNGEVGNGGITQFFANTSGDHARETLDALARIGDEVGRAILHDAMKAFGPSGPSPERGERTQQLDAMLPDPDSDEDDADATSPFEGIDGRWAENQTRSNLHLVNWMIAHAEHFRRA